MNRHISEIKKSIREAWRTCSLPARGLWLEVEYVMLNESKIFGHLLRGSERVSERQLATLAGIASDRVSETQDLLTELKDARDSGGRALLVMEGRTLVSPLLEELGRVRGGNAVRQQRYRDKVLHNTDSNAESNGKPPPSSPPQGFPPTTPLPNPTPPFPPEGFAGERTSEASAPGNEADEPNPVLELEGWELQGLSERQANPEFRRAFARWILNLRDAKKPPTARSVRAQVGQTDVMIQKFGLPAVLEAIEKTIANNYTGIIEPKNGTSKHPPRRTPAERGHFPEPDAPLPVLSRTRNGAR